MKMFSSREDSISPDYVTSFPNFDEEISFRNKFNREGLNFKRRKNHLESREEEADFTPFSPNRRSSSSRRKYNNDSIEQIIAEFH